MEIKILGGILNNTHYVQDCVWTLLANCCVKLQTSDFVFSLLFHLLYITYLSQKFSWKKSEKMKKTDKWLNNKNGLMMWKGFVGVLRCHYVVCLLIIFMCFYRTMNITVMKTAYLYVIRLSSCRWKISSYLFFSSKRLFVMGPHVCGAIISSYLLKNLFCV